MIEIKAPSSHQKSRPNQPSDVAIEATYATVIAIAISSIMPGARARASDMPPVRNGCPPQTNTIVPSTGPTQSTPGKSSS